MCSACMHNWGGHVLARMPCHQPSDVKEHDAIAGMDPRQQYSCMVGFRPDCNFPRSDSFLRQLKWDSCRRVVCHTSMLDCKFILMVLPGCVIHVVRGSQKTPLAVF